MNLNKMRIARLICAVILLIASAGCLANSRMGQIEIRDTSGVPCFAIPKAEEQRAGAVLMRSLNVYDVTFEGYDTLWSVGLEAKAPPMPISSNTCIDYGQPPAGMVVTKTDAPLIAGRIYEVILSGGTTDKHDPTFGYGARFCLVAQAHGAVKVHMIEYQNGWRYEACHTPN